MLFLQRPANLNRSEIRRVGRQIKDSDAAVTTHGRNARVMMGAHIVHHQDVARPQLRQQVPREPGDEAVRIGRRKHGPTQPVSRIAPSSVSVLPQFIGTGSMNSVPRVTHVWLRLIAVCTPDSSRKTSRSTGIARMRLRSRRRLAGTTGRATSDGRQRFL